MEKQLLTDLLSNGFLWPKDQLFSEEITKEIIRICSLLVDFFERLISSIALLECYNQIQSFMDKAEEFLPNLLKSHPSLDHSLLINSLETLSRHLQEAQKQGSESEITVLINRIGHFSSTL